ncbi:helix-turn-helix domain-containing protein [Enterococcus sp. AZ101]|uniref:helix-turn-helix domain-containing protein n=1 Tax=Enterococcus sp. AZ101 TaxID=2774742 RepID=UPI003D297DA2
MKYELFATLYQEALEYNDVEMYIAERGWQDWMDSFDNDKLGVVLTAVYSLANMTIKEMRESKKMSRAQFSRVYNIPIRTLENWDAETRKMTSYDKMLIAYTFFMDGFLDKGGERNE